MLICRLFAFLQTTLQLSIVATAIFAVVFLHTKLLCRQWGSLLLIVVGVVAIQFEEEQIYKFFITFGSIPNQLIGFGALLGACVAGGFKSVCIMEIQKDSDISLWLRCVQLCLIGIPISFFVCFVTDYQLIIQKGFFYGYNGPVFGLIGFNTFDFALLLILMKYSNKVIKGLASLLAIIITTVVSIFDDFQLKWEFGVGTSILIIAIIFYSCDPYTKTFESDDIPMPEIAANEEHKKCYKIENIDKNKSQITTEN